jgi:undecaprenyl-diphosphatase
MNPWYAVLLGIIQGITEFLPISSTAHLTLAGKLFGLIAADHPETWTEFIAVMQVGTLIAVIVYFWRDLLRMASSLIADLRSKGLRSGFRSYAQDSHLALLLVVGTLPVALIGFALKDLIEGTFTKTVLVLAGSLIALALLLWLAERISTHRRTLQELTWFDALVVGLAQALALIPGSSRSGTTITAGLFLGISRDAAARFSFLLSIPAVLASGVFELARIDPSVFEMGFLNLALATVVSGVAGYAAIAWLLRYLMKHSTMAFVWYRVALGVALLLLLRSGLITP